MKGSVTLTATIVKRKSRNEGYAQDFTIAVAGNAGSAGISINRPDAGIRAEDLVCSPEHSIYGGPFTITAPEGYDSYQWRIDGEARSETDRPPTQPLVRSPSRIGRFLAPILCTRFAKASR